jgi:hypothetical protein
MGGYVRRILDFLVLHSYRLRIESRVGGCPSNLERLFASRLGIAYPSYYLGSSKVG